MQRLILCHEGSVSFLQSVFSATSSSSADVAAAVSVVNNYSKNQKQNTGHTTNRCLNNRLTCPVAHSHKRMPLERYNSVSISCLSNSIVGVPLPAARISNSLSFGLRHSPSLTAFNLALKLTSWNFWPQIAFLLHKSGSLSLFLSLAMIALLALP